jgi:hypothetical protein
MDPPYRFGIEEEYFPGRRRHKKHAAPTRTSPENPGNLNRLLFDR